MPLYEATVPVRYTLPLLDALRRQRAPWLDGVLAQAGVDAATLSDPQAALTMSAFDVLLAAMAERTRRDDLGFELGSRITTQHHGALAAPLTRSRTLDDMLRMLARYHRLITPSFFLQFRRYTDRGEFVWRPAAPMSTTTLRALEEAFAVSSHAQIGAAVRERLAPYDIYLSMPAPRHEARYRKLLPARFHFGHLRLPEVRVIVGRALLDAPLQWNASATAVGAVADLAQLQRRIRPAARWSEWVVMMLRESECVQPKLTDLAALLAVSPRTLIRRLAGEGHTLRDLAKQVRHVRARRMLEDPRQPIGQIAWRLGYADATNFSHAFRAAEGSGPRRFRAARQPTEAGASRRSARDRARL